VESPSLEIFKPRLDKVLCSLLWVTLLRQGGWTGWSTEVPSNPYRSVILWHPVSIRINTTLIHTVSRCTRFFRKSKKKYRKWEQNGAGKEQVEPESFLFMSLAQTSHTCTTLQYMYGTTAGCRAHTVQQDMQDLNCHVRKNITLHTKTSGSSKRFSHMCPSCFASARNAVSTHLLGHKSPSTGQI